MWPSVANGRQQPPVILWPQLMIKDALNLVKGRRAQHRRLSIVSLDEVSVTRGAQRTGVFARSIHPMHLHSLCAVPPPDEPERIMHSLHGEKIDAAE